ncbi:alkaline phosphatase PhoX [Haloferula helveola]
MKTSIRTQLALTAALVGTAAAGTDTWFTPLTESALVVPPNGLEELASPWVTPTGISQKNAVSMREVEDAVLSPLQSIVRVPGLGTSASMFDMLAYDPSGEFLFIPHETFVGAGVTRYSVYDNSCEVLFSGDGTGNWANDYGAFDPCRFTPNGTLFLAEEWSGLGRVVEVMNPFAPADQIQTRVLTNFPRVSHEGINFSKKFDDTIYFVDEDRAGSIYKFVMATPGDYTVGQTFVLVVDAFLGDPSVNAPTGWTPDRIGSATWVPLTDATGTPLPGIPDPTVDPGRAGRGAADAAGGTPYRRPEDMAVGKLANGNEVIYFTATEEQTVYSVEMLENRPGNSQGKGHQKGHKGHNDGPSGAAIVRVFASETSTPKNVGFDPTTGVINSPDNLSIDALGNIYIIEDAPNGAPGGGDIWFVRDTDNDGVGESVDHFMTIQVDGAEATGMIWNPVIKSEFAVCVQHPDSTNLDNVPNGFGDAVWIFNVTPIPNQEFVEQLDAAEAPFGE